MLECLNMSDTKKLAKSWIINFIMVVILVGGGFFIGVTTAEKEGMANVFSVVPDDVDLHTFWHTWDILDEKYPFDENKPTTEDKVYGAVKGLASSYGDPYTVFFEPAEAKLFNEDVDGSFSGVGMEVAARGGFLVVIAPLKGTPAELSGILAGDVIAAINGEETSEMFLDEAIQKIRGKKGTEVTLEILRADEVEPIEIIVKRDTIVVPTVETEIVSPEIFRINLYSFSANATQDFTKALAMFEEGGYSKMIIDMRNNPGGFMEAAVDVASFFVPQGKPIVIEDFGEKQEEVIYRSKGLPFKQPENFEMVVLVDHGSASASEIVAGALSEYEIGTLVGSQTFGKGSVQELINLPDKSSVKVTIAHWLTPNRNSINDNGLVPEHIVEVTPEDRENDKDPQLDKAIELLQKD